MVLFVLIGESFFSFFLFVTNLKSVKSGEAEAFSLNGATDGKEGIDRFVIAGGALGRGELFRTRISRDIWIGLDLEEGGGQITAGETSKSSDMLYSNVSPSDAEEELISASA
ncbi:hypothetical protein AVEN_247809-1 [Araneus ventricosus]|uniref:Uncharacterized protein n=1 Tax=Araneus ventricosus TaxID=182803 RepID=A0A4Y2SYR8_ARAVE|nr:hypothetical protein AVEN_247809-1 [Araneus ventricosus]